MRAARLLLLLSFAAHAAPLLAHPLAPSLLELRELGGGQVALRFVTPASQPRGTALEPVLPPRCRLLGDPQLRTLDAALVLEAKLDCGANGLVDTELGLSGLHETQTNAIVRVSFADGHEQQDVLHAARPRMRVASQPGAGRAFLSYLRLGFEHILRGPDHLLFVTGLLLLAGAARPLVQTITAFTLGHSLTLAAAVLGPVRLPSAPVEVAIAFSLLWLASSLLLARRTSAPATRGRSAALACAFGLLHGLGFAGALAEVDLPGGDVPLALAGFNLGIEIAQLLFVSAVLALLWALGRVLSRFASSARTGPEVSSRSLWTRPGWADASFAWALGSLAAFWIFERAAAAL